jgi:hypothetical protein
MNSKTETRQGLCTSGELLDALQNVLPLGVALMCMQTAVESGAVFRNGEYHPDKLESRQASVNGHFRPWLPRLSIADRTAIQRLCEPVGAMLNGVLMTRLLVALSSEIAAKAIARGYVSEGEAEALRNAESTAFYKKILSDLVDDPPVGFDGDIDKLSQRALTVDE